MRSKGNAASELYFVDAEIVANARDFGADLHYHEHGQLSYMQRGLMQVRTESAGWVIPEGRLYWTPPGLLHAATCSGFSSFWQILVSDGYTSSLPSLCTVIRPSELLLACLRRAISETATARRDVRIMSEHSLALLHALIESELRTAELESFGIAVPIAEPWRSVAQYLLAHPADRRGVNEWAAYSGMSPRSFTRNFAKATGMAFSRWQQAARGQKALELLNRKFTVSDVALELGYENVSAFIFAFRQQFGTTPGRFFDREKNGEGVVSDR